MNPLWKDSWVVGTSGGAEEGVTADRAGSIRPELQAAKVLGPEKNGFPGGPAGLWSYTQNFRIS